MEVPRPGQVVAWIPNNEILKRDGVTDTADATRTYLHTIIGDVVPAEKSFVCKNSPLKLCWVPGYADYYPETPGGTPTRSVEPKPFNAQRGRHHPVRHRGTRSAIGIPATWWCVLGSLHSD